ncbi:MAG: methyl-accepting chemotaxis protein [Nitrospirota bacterium]
MAAAHLASDTLDKVDRNLFERYGDVQAFAGSEAARSRDPKRLTAVMNRMVRIYAPMYRLMVMADRSGKVIAVNTVGPKGEDLDSTSLIGTDVSHELWFRQAISGNVKDGETLIGDLYEDSAVASLYRDQGRVLAFTYPVKDREGKLIGVWSNRFDWSVVEELLREVEMRAVQKAGNHIRLTLVNKDGSVIVSPSDMRTVRSNLRENPSVRAVLEQGKGVSGFIDGTNLYTGTPALLGYARAAGYGPFQGFGWGLLVGQDRDEAYAAVYALRGRLLWILVILTGLAVAAAVVLSRSLTKALADAITMIATICNDWDLTRRLTVNGKDEVGRLCETFNHFMDKLEDAMTRVASLIASLAASVEKLSANTGQLVKGGQEQAQQAIQASAAVEEMSATVTEMAKHAQVVASKAQAANQAARQGNEVVTASVTGMMHLAETIRDSSGRIQMLGQRSEQIGEIVRVIEEIADQTNLLALNAAIEAARAGEQGRGFAVVADEVRKLAERTTKATKEIADTIRTIQGDTTVAVEAMQAATRETEEGTGLAQRAGACLSEIVGAVETVTNMVQQIAAAVEEQSTVTHQIASNIEVTAEVSKRNEGGIGQIGAASADLARLANELQAVVSGFKLRH